MITVDREKYFEAVETVCMDCAYGEETCVDCPVRKSIDKKEKQNLNEYKVGDTLYFGKWDGKLIEWIVLNVDMREERALLLSKYALERKGYHEVRKPITWKDSSIRHYLQNDFINRAFNAEEKEKIVSATNHNADNPVYGTSGGNSTYDRVFLLSIDEFKLYLEKETFKPYAACKNLDLESVWWWLRSPGSIDFIAADVRSDGSLRPNGSGVGNEDVWVRPALYLNLKS